MSARIFVLTAALLWVTGMTSADVKQQTDQNHVSVTIDGKPFTDYWFGERSDRPYARPFFYPVLAPDGAAVTTDQYGQKEHPHHNSLWVGQGDVNGADHWALNGDKTPKQRHIRFERIGGDTLIEDLEWEDANHQPMLGERRTLKFAKLDDKSRAIDFTLEFTPIHSDVTFGDTKEAGLVAIRVAKSISDHPTLTNSTGAHGEKATWGKPADWCDISGQISGKEYGIAVFDHPSNPRHPTRWHVREYGLLGANPFGLSYFDTGTPKHAGDFKMEPGKTITFRYRVVVHEGDVRSARLDEKYREYAR
jgi:hypothetical protein